MRSHSLFLWLGCVLLAGCSANRPPYCPVPQRVEEPVPAAASGDGPLRRKALEYDRYLQKTLWPHPHGGVVNAVFKDAKLHDRHDISGYDDQSDSTIWTGTYLAAEAFRYAATADPQEKAEALDNARRAFETLHFFLEVTGTPGYLARFAGPLDPKFLPGGGGPASCTAAIHCYPTPDGKTFWLGDTSRDQYTGWFFGMGVAHRLIPDLRPKIEGDVDTVITALQGWKWVIGGKEVKGQTEGEVEPAMRLTWLRIAAEVLDDRPEICQEIEKMVREGWPVVGTVVEDDANWTNRYMQYYGLNLAFVNNYHLILLEPNQRRRELFLRSFQNGPYRDVRGTGNVFFDYIARATGVSTLPGTSGQDLAVLEEFPASPRVSTCPCPPKARLNGLSVFLYRLNKLLLPKKVKIFPQAKSPYPLSQRCPDDFIWQQSPYTINCCCAAGSCPPWSKYQNALCTNSASSTSTSAEATATPVTVFPGVDYLVAYWMGRYHGFLGAER